MIDVRRMHDDEARIFLEVHHASVRGLATGDYRQPVIDDWAPLPVTPLEWRAPSALS